ncbi:hypothetical protein LZ30DRAFT_817005 [Colletotrichum cereale]|nr:hypothetical protein LZ30DRAFT_817005 [Colletotrichum cereale]
MAGRQPLLEKAEVTTMSESIPKMTTKAWKLWAKQQIHPRFFATGPCMSNIYSFDEELGVYLTFAGKAVVRRLENVVWDEKAQVPAEKTKQQIYASMVAGTTRIQTNYAPSAAELEALRIINGLVLPSDIVDLLAQAGHKRGSCNRE